MMLDLKEIQEIERFIGCKFPERVIIEALDANSSLREGDDAYRFTFLSIEEHRKLKVFRESEERSPLSQIPELKILWMDGESNFMGIFVSGPMLGRLALVGHDTNIDCAPLYRNLDSFLGAVKTGFETPENDWPYRVDYPNTGDELQIAPSNSDIEADVICIKSIESVANSEGNVLRKRFLFSCVASLTPKEHVASLFPMLESSDFHVCGRACSMLGYHRFDAACSKLAQIAIDATNPARFCAVDGLGLMNTESSQKILGELVRIGEPLPGNITTALRKNSFELSTQTSSQGCQKNIGWYVRLNEGENLEKICLDDQPRPFPWWRVGQ